jgi:hypothetical protein
MPRFLECLSSRAALTLLSLIAAASGISIAFVSLLFLHGESLSLAAVAGAVLLVRGFVFRHNMSVSPNGWVLAAVAFPFCAVLLPGGLYALTRAPTLSGMSHDSLRELIQLVHTPYILVAAVSTLTITAFLHQEVEARWVGCERSEGGGCLQMPIPASPTNVHHHEE